MRKKFAGSLAVAGVLALGIGAPGASAAHCTDTGPGASYFGTVHQQAATHNEGTTHQGYSSCVEQANSGPRNDR